MPNYNESISDFTHAFYGNSGAIRITGAGTAEPTSTTEWLGGGTTSPHVQSTTPDWNEFYKGILPTAPNAPNSPAASMRDNWWSNLGKYGLPVSLPRVRPDPFPVDSDVPLNVSGPSKPKAPGIVKKAVTAFQKRQAAKAAKAKPSSNYTAASEAAYNAGKKSYDVAPGISMPTTTISGAKRNTYADNLNIW